MDRSVRAAAHPYRRKPSLHTSHCGSRGKSDVSLTDSPFFYPFLVVLHRLSLYLFLNLFLSFFLFFPFFLFLSLLTYCNVNFKQNSNKTYFCIVV